MAPPSDRDPRDSLWAWYRARREPRSPWSTGAVDVVLLWAVSAGDPPHGWDARDASCWYCWWRYGDATVVLASHGPSVRAYVFCGATIQEWDWVWPIEIVWTGTPVDALVERPQRVQDAGLPTLATVAAWVRLLRHRRLRA